MIGYKYGYPSTDKYRMIGIEGNRRGEDDWKREEKSIKEEGIDQKRRGRMD